MRYLVLAVLISPALMLTYLMLTAPDFPALGRLQAIMLGWAMMIGLLIRWRS
jgi:hypothetical protein